MHDSNKIKIKCNTLEPQEEFNKNVKHVENLDSKSSKKTRLKTR